MRVLDFLTPSGIISSLTATSKEEVLAELVEPIANAYPGINKVHLVDTLIGRENLGSTGIGGGVAIPHGKLDGLEHLVASFGKSSKGVDFNSMDNRPAFLFFLLIAPKNSAGEHLKALARISRLFKDPLLKTALQHAHTADEIYRILEEFDLRVP
jgi:PTS system nitrogen regulatory IIA component